MHNNICFDNIVYFLDLYLAFVFYGFLVENHGKYEKLGLQLLNDKTVMWCFSDQQVAGLS